MPAPAAAALRLRSDDQDLADALTRGAADPPPGGPCVLLRTAVETTYPTVGRVFFHCELITIRGESEAEGSTTEPTGAERFVKAYNYGTTVPPVGTYVIGCAVPYGYVFHYPK